MNGLGATYNPIDYCDRARKQDQPGYEDEGPATRLIEYPNPTGSDMIFRMEGEFAGSCTVEIFSLHGVKIGSVKLDENQREGKFSASGVTSGVYIWKAIVNGREITGKVTVMR